MNIADLFDNASSAMTVISFVTFVGIIWWTFVRHKDRDFAAAAQLPFADEDAVAKQAADIRQEQGHV